MKPDGGGVSESKLASKFNMTISRGDTHSPERRIQINGAYLVRKEALEFQTNFLYTINIADEINLTSRGDSTRQPVRYGAILQINYLEIVDSGDGVLRILANIRDDTTENTHFEFVYSLDNGETWQRVPLEFTDNSYNTQIPFEPEKLLIWTIVFRNQNESMDMDSPVWNFWVMNPPVCTEEGMALSIPCIIVGVATPTDITITQFKHREAVQADKNRVMALANLLSDEEILVRREEHTFGVVLSFFDQFEGPLPIIGVPELLEDNFQFLMTLSDQAFNATGFVEETSEEKIAIFDIKLENIPMKCLSWAFAIDVLEARGGRDNMTLNLLVNPKYGDLVINLSSEIIPTIRWIRSLIENKTPRENIATQMSGIRNLCSRIITAYQEIYG